MNETFSNEVVTKTVKDYVVGFLVSTGSNEDSYYNENTHSWNIVLVRKKKPAFQKDLLNGIGGGIEFGEKPYDAMVREFKEETGAEIKNWELYCEVQREGSYNLYFYKAYVTKMPEMKDVNDIGEKLEIHQVNNELVTRSDLIPNLRWLLNLAFFDDHKSKGKVIYYD